MAESDFIGKQAVADIEQKLFSSKKKLRNLELLQDLIQDKGWVMITEVLNISIVRLTAKLLDPESAHDQETDDRDREVLGLFKWLRELPEKLIGIFGDKPQKSEIPDHDPYPKSAD